ncbi:MAG: hypothetical protein HAW58_01025 [Candidatus Thioglobus sp.]|nr:hypothetical protein [Candidatus Thioglobus sp.]
MQELLDFLLQYQQFFVILGLLSSALFIGTLLLTPYLLGLIPVNYFVVKTQKNSYNFWILGLKNILGLLLILAGIIMLITPGQGIISILVGLFLMDFPGKRNLEIKLIGHNGTFKTVNWLRNKAGKPPFIR